MTHETPALGWRLRLLGGFALERQDHRLTRLHSRAAVLLLARLALQPQRDHAREELAGWLWPEADAPTGLARLRQTLSTLKGLLERDATLGAAAGTAGRVIDTDRVALRLAPGAMPCDAVLFEAACRRGDTGVAAELYRGELLPGHYDDWIIEQRQRLQALADALPGEAGAAAMSAAPPMAPGSPAAVWPSAATALPQDALPHYLTPLVGPGAAALAALAQRERLLVVRGTGGLGKTRLAVAAARQLMLQGRFDTVRFVPWAGCKGTAQAQALLARTLGLAVANAGAPDTANLADVADPGRAVDPGAPDGPGPAGRACELGPTEAIARALAGRRALLVLDNCEQLPDATLSALPHWLERLPLLHLMLTSRRALPLPGQVEWQPPALGCPVEGEGFPALGQAAAVQLFVDRARASRADFQLHAGNAQAVAQVTRLLGGLPLALELAAAQVRTWPPGRLVRQLGAPGAARWKLLARAGGADRAHGSLAAVVHGSLALLDPVALALLQQLAVMPAPFAGTQALLLLALQARDPAGADDAGREAFESLVAASLMVPVGDDEEDRWWTLPEPVRDLVLDALAPAQRQAAARGWCTALQRWAAQALGPAWSLRNIERCLPALVWLLGADAADAAAPAPGLPLQPPGSTEPSDSYPVAAPEAAGVLASQRLALLLAFAPVWHERNPPPAALPVLEAALHLPGHALDPGTRQAAHALGVTANLAAGRAAHARTHAGRLQALLAWPDLRIEASAALGAAVGAEAARAHLALARLAWHGDADAVRARAHLAAAKRLAQAPGGPRPAADILRLEGTLANESDADPAAAGAAYAQALRLLAAEPGRHPHLERALRYNLAITAVYAGRSAQAHPELVSLVEQARAAGDRQLLMKALNACGSALEDLGRLDEAEAATRTALAEAWAALETETALYALWNLAPMALARGDAARAARLMGFADAFWRLHFGPLAASDARDVARLRRRCRRQQGRAEGQRCWDEGAALPLAAAVALALG